MAQSPKIQPLGARVLIKPEEAGTTTPGGLIVPPSAQDERKPEKGTVVKLGTGEKDKEFKMKVGDVVFFKKYSPEELEVDGEKYFIVDVDEILAVIG